MKKKGLLNIFAPPSHFISIELSKIKILNYKLLF